VAQLGANAFGEVLESGRVPDCHFGLRRDPDDANPNDTGAAGVLVVAPAALLHPVVPQPDGTVLYQLLTGHPDRTPRELVFLGDLTVELHAWPPTPGPRSGSTRSRPPAQWWPAGSAATCQMRSPTPYPAAGA
jgi:hypothetical protein